MFSWRNKKNIYLILHLIWMYVRGVFGSIVFLLCPEKSVLWLHIGIISERSSKYVPMIYRFLMSTHHSGEYAHVFARNEKKYQYFLVQKSNLKFVIQDVVMYYFCL